MELNIDQDRLTHAPSEGGLLVDNASANYLALTHFGNKPLPAQPLEVPT